MARLELAYLGGMQLRLGGKALTGLSYIKAQALLCYLAMTGRQHARESLAYLLWSELPNKAALQNLRNVLSDLRRVLPDHLLITRKTVAFNRQSSYVLDVEVFLEKLSGHEGRALEQLREAVGTYRGDLLEGFQTRDALEFEAWLAGERERLRQLLMQALYTLALHHQGNCGAGIGYLNRLLALEPWHEAAHRQLMLLLALSGQRDAALDQYRKCREILAAELGVAPIEETNTLYTRIRAGEIAAERSSYVLPSPLTPLLGRASELTQVKALLMNAKHRLVTLVGLGGIGKTRLALEAAAELRTSFTGGVIFVSLAPLEHATLVASAIAQALGIQETSERPVFNNLQTYLRHKNVLLVLDNFEHLLETAPLVGELLSQCPELKVLATSREALRLRGEQEFPLSPLAVPNLNHLPSPKKLLDYPAVALFEERARAIKPSFTVDDENATAIAAICVRLDGLPLALELAASQIKLLSPRAILEQWEAGDRSPLQILLGGARDAPKRQQTLRAAITWSYNLLGDAEQKLFQRLTVFVGGRTLEAIDAVCNPDNDLGDSFERVASLVHKHLLRELEIEGETRFLMLRTIRDYALELLETSGQAPALRRAHALYFLALAQEAQAQLTGATQIRWLNQLEREHDNLRAALGWTLEHDPELGLQLAGALWRFWQRHSHFREGRRWLTAMLAPSGSSPRARAQALLGLGVLTHFQNDYLQASLLLEDALTLWRNLGDEAKLATTLNYLAGTVQLQNDYARAAHLYEESLRLSGGEWDIAYALYGLAELALRENNHQRAASLCQESRAIFQRLGDIGNVAGSGNILGQVAQRQGNEREAAALYQENLTLYNQVGNKHGINWTLDLLAALALRQGDHKRAAALCREHLARAWEIDSKIGIANALRGLAEAYAAQGREEYAVRLYGAADTAYPVESTKRAHYERALAEARAPLGDSAFAQAWAAGQSSSLESTISCELEGHLATHLVASAATPLPQP